MYTHAVLICINLDLLFPPQLDFKVICQYHGVQSSSTALLKNYKDKTDISHRHAPHCLRMTECTINLCNQQHFVGKCI